MKNINNKLSDISALTVNGESQLIGLLNVLSPSTIMLKKQISGVDNASISIESDGDINLSNKTQIRLFSELGSENTDILVNTFSFTSTITNALVQSVISQDASTIQLNAETINLFTGLSGIEMDNSSIEVDTTILNYNGSEVARKNDTGWASYRDTSHTVGSPLVILDTVTATVTNNAGTVINSELPAGVTSFYNSGTSKLTPELDGDYYIFAIRFNAKNSATLGGYMDFGIDVGGAVGVIFKETLIFPKGAGVEHNFTVSCPGYTAATFIANGGLVKLTAGGGDLDIYDIEYQITRVHKKI